MDLSRRQMLVISAAAAASFGFAGTAEAAEYITLGTRMVSLRSDHDRIYVGPLRGLFTRIRLEVAGNAIFMQDLKVTFMNGETADLPVRVLIPEGGWTRDINLPGIARLIAHIDLRYRRVPLGGRAKVTIVGKRL